MIVLPAPAIEITHIQEIYTRYIKYTISNICGLNTEVYIIIGILLTHVTQKYSNMYLKFKIFFRKNTLHCLLFYISHTNLYIYFFCGEISRHASAAGDNIAMTEELICFNLLTSHQSVIEGYTSLWLFYTADLRMFEIRLTFLSWLTKSAGSVFRRKTK